MKRVPVTISVTVAVLFFSVLSSLSFGSWKDVTVLGMTFFDLFDNITSKVLMPLGGLLIALFAGWVMPVKLLKAEISNEGQFKLKLFTVYLFLIRYIAPLGILMVLLNQISSF
jgi:NSS family neurotransmitter:Na+ symporter